MSTSMTTVLLSKFTHAVYGFWWAGEFDTLTTWSVHPASVLLLTRITPLTTLYSNSAGLIKQPSTSHPFKVWEQTKDIASPNSLIIRFTRCNYCFGWCYPKGNFGRNQLLDGSISLSPLYPSLTIDLHVRTASSLHQGFPWLHPTRT